LQSCQANFPDCGCLPKVALQYGFYGLHASNHIPQPSR